MKRSEFTEERIISILKESEAGKKAAEISWRGLRSKTYSLSRPLL